LDIDNTISPTGPESSKKDVSMIILFCWLIVADLVKETAPWFYKSRNRYSTPASLGHHTPKPELTQDHTIKPYSTDESDSKKVETIK
jgi:hypothetical protein